MFTTILAVVAAVLGAASLILHAVAPRTSATWDDKLEEFVDEGLALLGSKVNDGAPAVEPAKTDAVAKV